jgi:deoxyribonuclease-4
LIRLGAQVSVRGGIGPAVLRAGAAGWHALQIFSRNPVGGQELPLPPPELARQWLERAGIRSLLVHAPYFVNPAAEDVAMVGRARRVLTTEMSRARKLAATAVIMHGGHVQGSPDHARGALELTLKAMLARPGEVWMENAAGQGRELLADLDELAGVIDRIGSRRLAVILDTAHAMAVGHELKTAADVQRWLQRVDCAVRLTRVRGLHLNDLKDPVGARRDRHASLLQGSLGRPALQSLLEAADRGNWTVILETPGRDVASRAADVAIVRELLSHKE